MVRGVEVMLGERRYRLWISRSLWEMRWGWDGMIRLRAKVRWGRAVRNFKDNERRLE